MLRRISIMEHEGDRNERLTSSMSTSSGVCSALSLFPSKTNATDSGSTDAFAQYACMSFLRSTSLTRYQCLALESHATNRNTHSRAISERT